MTDDGAATVLPDSRVLGWLLATQNVLQALPERRLVEFVPGALKDVPGVATARLRLADETAGEAPEPNGPAGRTFSLDTSHSHYGAIEVTLADPGAFEPYAPFVANYAGSLALLLENRRQRAEQRSVFQRLQEALLESPVARPGITLAHLYRSATREAQVGGDFYDVFQAQGGLIGLLMGDVSGHGVDAARTAMIVKDSVRALARCHRQPCVVLRETNLLLIDRRIAGFVTAFVVFIDIRDGHLVFSSAGHPPALHVGAQASRLLECFNLPLGVFAEASYREAETTMAPGDRLVLYTDGISEARHGSSFFGEARVMEAVERRRAAALEEVPSLLFAEALRFSRGELHDDAAILAVSLTGG